MVESFGNSGGDSRFDHLYRDDRFAKLSEADKDLIVAAVLDSDAEIIADRIEEDDFSDSELEEQFNAFRSACSFVLKELED